MKRIAILGSTGSIGRSTLNIVENYPERFQITSLAAGSNVDAAVEQAQRWKPRVLWLTSEKNAHTLRAWLQSAGVSGIEIAHGAAGPGRGATHHAVDIVVSAIVGVAGLAANSQAAREGTG